MVRVLRSSELDNVNLKIPMNKRRTFGDRAFSHSGPKIWNELPVDIKTTKSYIAFKGLLKTSIVKHLR